MRLAPTLLLLALLLPPGSEAQTVVGRRQDLAFDRPESWAMAYATAATLYHGLAPPPALAVGDLRLGVELGSIPRIPRERTRVGFNGTKLEDLNKSPVFGRARLWLGLPARFSLEFAYTPPVSIDGIRADGIYALALGRDLFESDHWRLGARAFGQGAHARGSVTCSRATVAAGLDDPIANPFGCRRPSRDDVELDYYGLELNAAWQRPGWSPFLAWSIARIHPEVQVHALTRNVIDRSRLVTEGLLRSGTLGASFQSRSGLRWSLALAWTPLDVRREGRLESDDFWSLRVMMDLSPETLFSRERTTR